MKTRINIFALLMLSLCAASTVANDGEKKLAESMKTWQEVRDKNDGNYSYKISWSSFVGFGHETTIVVRDNKVTERHFRSFSGRPIKPDAKPEGKSWVEKGKTLGTHKEGAPLKTMDQLYSEATEILKRDLPKHERRYLRFNKQGLLLSCFTVDTRIADDAPRSGVAITSVVLGTGEKTKGEKEGAR